MQFVLRAGLYVAAIAVVAAVTAWSAFRVGESAVDMLDAKIIDGSGRALPDPQWSAPPFASDPRSEEAPEPKTVTTRAESQLTSASDAPLPPPQRVSSDAPENDPAYAFHNGSTSTYKTYCVRLCDGFYWPISFSTTSDRFEEDAATCRSSCGSPARLFVHPIPGGGPGTMVSLEGLPYTALKSAFLFRVRYNAQCRCQAQPWQEASKIKHELYTAAEAAKKGDPAAMAKALQLKDKITKERREELALRKSADEKANIDLEKLAQTTALTPPERVERRRRVAAVRRDENMMRLGALDEEAAPSKRGFRATTGPGRGWQDRVFGGN